MTKTKTGTAADAFAIGDRVTINPNREDIRRSAVVRDIARSDTTGAIIAIRGDVEGGGEWWYVLNGWHIVRGESPAATAYVIGSSFACKRCAEEHDGRRIVPEQSLDQARFIKCAFCGVGVDIYATTD